MCGIAGYIGLNKIFPSKTNINKCLKIMEKRGPDHQSYKVFNTYPKQLFCSSRLSIIDLKDRSNQPFEDDEGIITFNGEIYNYIELKKKLKKKGVVFTTNSDTEVLLKFLNIYGHKKLSELEGMWSFAYYSKKKNETIISRDKFGEKPLYYLISKKNRFFIFGSNVNYIKTLSKSKIKINKKKILNFLRDGYRNVFTTNETFFKEIYSLEAGNSIIIDKKLNFKFKKYWKKSKYSPKNYNLKFLANKLKGLIKMNFKKSFRSDRPLALLLSGGIDSSVVAYLTRIIKTKTKFFSFRSGSKKYDEKNNIDKIVKKFNLNHEYVYPNKKNNFIILKNMINDFGFPLMSSTYLAYAQLCKVIKKQNYKVLISGNGGDELFSGYYSHHMSYLLSTEKEKKFNKYLNDWKRNTRPYVRLEILKDLEKFKNLKNSSNPTFHESSYYLKFFKENYKNKKTNKKFEKDIFINHLNTDLFRDSLPAQVHSIDNVSMHYSIESRAPFLFQNLFDFRNKINKYLFVKNGVAKYILRRAFKNCIPNEIINEKEKIGFYSTLNETIDLNSKKVVSLILNCSITKKYLKRNLIKLKIEKKELNHQDEKFLFCLLNVALFLKKYRK